MLSKNFLATHQVDVDLWTEFLYVACRANCPSHLVCRKRAITLHVEEAQHGHLELEEVGKGIMEGEVTLAANDTHLAPSEGNNEADSSFPSSSR